MTLSVDQPEFPPAANYQEFRFLVCGRTFDPNRVDQRIPLGAVEEWIVVNEHEDDHVVHIHTNPFQMVAINGEKVADQDWGDTVLVPRKGSVTFRSRWSYTRPTIFLHGDTHRFARTSRFLAPRTVRVSRTSRVLRPSAARIPIGSRLRSTQPTPRYSRSKRN